MGLAAGALVPWAAALHAVALPAAVGIAIARAKGTVPPRARTVPLAAAAAAGSALLLALVFRAAAPEAASLLVTLFGPLLAAGGILLALGVGLGLVARPWPTWATAGALTLSLVAFSAPLSFLSTPGSWPSSGSRLDAIVNPTLLPLLLGRLGAAAAFCGAALIACARRGGELPRARAARAGGALSIGGAGAMALAAWLWLRALADAPVEQLLDEVALTGAAATVATFALPAFAALALLVAWIAGFRATPLRPSAVLVLALVAGAGVGAAEVARVGLSGPWIVGGRLYGNGLTDEETFAAQRSGLATVRPGIGPRTKEPSAERGGRVFGVACAPCHAERAMGRRLAGWPRTAIAAAVARLDRLAAASPPFPGDAADREDLSLHLALLDGSASGALPPPDPARVAEGERIFAATCAHCHRETRLERRVAGWCEPLAFDVVGRLHRMNAAMPRLELGEEERRALAAYVVTLGGARAAPARPAPTPPTPSAPAPPRSGAPRRRGRPPAPRPSSA